MYKRGYIYGWNEAEISRWVPRCTEGFRRYVPDGATETCRKVPLKNGKENRCREVPKGLEESGRRLPARNLASSSLNSRQKAQIATWLHGGAPGPKIKLESCSKSTGWVIGLFRFDNAKRRLGCCFHYEKIISLAAGFVAVAPRASIRNVLLHKVAHALVGHRHGHDTEWRERALKIGCDGQRCSNARPWAAADYFIRCPCGRVRLFRHKVIRTMLFRVCVSCGGSLEVWTRDKKS